MRKILLPIAFILMMIGCANQEEQRQQIKDEPLPQGVSVKNSHIDTKTTFSDEQRADHLVKLVSGIPNVHDATAVVFGRYALVGIDVDKDMDRSKVGTVKYTVAESLKNDPHGAGAIVVADPDLYARLKELNDDIQSGRPIDGLLNELADITSRIIPELPMDEQTVDPEHAPEEPKQQMNDQKDKLLEKNQEEQSHHQK